jgi:excisionase family DNA binding protein
MTTLSNMVHESKLLTEDEAAELVGLSVRTLQAWRSRGVGPAYVHVGRKVRYRLSDINRWISANTVTHGAAGVEA